MEKEDSPFPVRLDQSPVDEVQDIPFHSEGGRCRVCMGDLSAEMMQVGLCNDVLCLLSSDRRVCSLLLDFAYSASRAGRLEVDPPLYSGGGTKLCQSLNHIPYDCDLETMMRSLPGDQLEVLRPTLSVLFRWVLATNRSHITYVDEEKPYFAVAANSPEKEALFQELKTKYGSVNLYHGSPLSNWHNILRDGLKDYSVAKNRTKGVAFGPGIYCSTDYLFSTLHAASRSDGESIAARNNIDTSVVAMVEVILAPPSGGQVVYPNRSCPHYRVLDTDYISIRGLIVRPSVF